MKRGERERGRERGTEEKTNKERRLRKKPGIKYIQPSKGLLLWDQLPPNKPPSQSSHHLPVA